ncbi:MAG: acyl carrier protein [Acidobacteria bacterium]|nr:acyl carrier protein [Acidobacteriota bacterium]
MNPVSEIRRIISENLRVPASTIQPDSKASELPNWDSLNHLTIVMQIEQTFGMHFDLEEIGELNSVDKIVKAVEKRQL